MPKSLWYRCFGWGKIPRSKQSEYEGEGILFAEEGMRGTVTFKGYNSPSFYASWKKKRICGCLVLTRKRLAVHSAFGCPVTIPITRPAGDTLKVDTENANSLRVDFDAQDFIPGHSGHVTIRFRVSDAGAKMHELRAALSA